MCWVALTLPRSAGYIQHPPHPVLLQQGHHPASVLLRPALRVSDVQLPHFRRFAIGVLIGETHGGHTERPGPKHAVDRHAAASTCAYLRVFLPNRAAGTVFSGCGSAPPLTGTLPTCQPRCCYYLYERPRRNFQPITRCRGLPPTFWLANLRRARPFALYVGERPSRKTDCLFICLILP